MPQSMESVVNKNIQHVHILLNSYLLPERAADMYTLRLRSNTNIVFLTFVDIVRIRLVCRSRAIHTHLLRCWMQFHFFLFLLINR